MAEDYKPIICIDFDGVIHDYQRGWQKGEIYGKVMPGFFTWAMEAKEHFKLVVYSSRSKTPEGISAMHRWMYDEAAEWPDRPCATSEILEWFEFASEKPPAFLTIDDRAVCFKGDWRDYFLQPGVLKAFKTWSQK